MAISISISPPNGTGIKIYTVTVTSDSNDTQQVALSAAVNPAAACTIAMPTVTVSPQGTAATPCTVGCVVQDSVLTITGVDGSETETATANIAAGSFTLEVTPGNGLGNAVYKVVLTSHNNFSGTVLLSCSANPAALCTLDDNSLFLSAGSSAQTRCRVGTVIDTTTLTITASFTQNGTTITESVSVTVTAGDFSLAINPPTGTGNIQYGITAASHHNFAGTVHLDFAANPNAIVTPQALSLDLAPGGTAQTNCQLGTVIQQTDLSVTGSYTQNGLTITDTKDAAVSPGSFGVAITPTSAASGSLFTVTVNSNGKFAGTVMLLLSINQGGSVTPAAVPVVVPIDGSGNVQVTATNPGSDDATLTATGSFTQNGFTISASGTATVTAGVIVAAARRAGAAPRGAANA